MKYRIVKEIEAHVVGGSGSELSYIANWCGGTVGMWPNKPTVNLSNGSIAHEGDHIVKQDDGTFTSMNSIDFKRMVVGAETDS